MLICFDVIGFMYVCSNFFIVSFFSYGPSVLKYTTDRLLDWKQIINHSDIQNQKVIKQN